MARLTAGKLIGEIAGADRFKSDAQLAHFAGCAPIPASSGRTERYRFDRDGNRQGFDSGRISRVIRRSISTVNPMESKRIKLDPRAVEAIARQVVEILERRGLQQRELVDAAELARQFGIERSWVYSHAIELGAVKLGSGPKPRLRFDPQIAARVLRKAGEQTAADPPARSGKRAERPSAGGGSGVRLLPIRGRGKNEPPPAA